MDTHCQMIFDEYVSVRPSLEMLKDIVLNEIHQMLAEKSLYVTAVEARVKSNESLTGKLELKGHKYASFTDITDLVGARIVVFYINEIDKIASLIENRFDIDWENSIDKRKLLNTDQFGYMSLHYVCRIPASLCSVPNHPEINEYRFEIQLRTALQHVWATAYHDIGYKSNMDIPREYIRSLNRLSGLLEIADTEFASIITDIKDYRRKVHALIADGHFDNLPLNEDTFNDYLLLNPYQHLNAKIAGINSSEIHSANFTAYLPVFHQFGFTTLGDLEKLKNEYADIAFNLAALQLGNTDLDILSETIGLYNLCLAYILKQNLGLQGIVKFLEILTQRKGQEMLAQRIFAKAQSIHLA